METDGAYLGQIYVDGNVIEGNEEVTNDNWTEGIYEQIDGENNDNIFTEQVKKDIRLSLPLETDIVTTHSGQKAYELVLAYAGCSRFRDISTPYCRRSKKRHSFIFGKQIFGRRELSGTYRLTR
jgi:hypothetical protein